VYLAAVEIPKISYSKEEELANALSHLFGLLAGTVGVTFFSILAWDRLTLVGNIGVWVYGFSLLCALGSSTAYHATVEPRLKFLFKKLDHICIYLLISGSYTVIILNRIRTTEGYVLLAVLWTMSAVGVWFKARYVHRFKFISTLMYIIMGYIFLFAPEVFYTRLRPDTMQLLVGCGLAYTFGAVFYLWKSLRWTHFIWHLMVLTGASLHFFAVYRELIAE